MEAEEIGFSLNEAGLLIPDDPGLEPLFQHCAGGLEAVTLDYFLKVVKPLLSLHLSKYVKVSWEYKKGCYQSEHI